MPLFEVVRYRTGTVDKTLLYATSIEVIHQILQRSNYNLIQAQVCTIHPLYLYWYRVHVVRSWQSVVSLMNGGLHLTQALNIVSVYEHSLAGKWFQALADGLEQGYSLGELLNEIRLLNDLEKNSLVAAYNHGELLKSLQKISSQQIEYAELLSSFKRLAAIPFFAIMSILIFIGFFLHVILPSLYSNIKIMNFSYTHEQRQFLRFVEYIIDYSSTIFVCFVAALSVLVFFIIRALRNVRNFHYFLKIPIFNKLFIGNDLYKISSFLSLALSAGLPIHQALNLAIQQTRVSRIKNELQVLHDMVLAGHQLDAMYAKTSFAKCFPETLVMLRVGFASGNVALAFDRIEGYVKKQLFVLIKRFQLVIQPFLLLIAALIIVFFIKKIYFPILMLPLEATASISL